MVCCTYKVRAGNGSFLFHNGEYMANDIKSVLTKAKAAKEARSGKDMGKKGKNFSKIAARATKEYGSKEEGEKVAGSVFQKMRKAGKL
jgi:hypothetical protein